MTDLKSTASGKLSQTRAPRVGDHCEWGVIQHVEKLASGVWAVSTSSHGGIRLSERREAAMPEAYRQAARYAPPGWYEEDCEWALVAMIHPDAFMHMPEFDRIAKKTIERYYPELLATGWEVIK